MIRTVLQVIFDFIFPTLLVLYLVVDILYPSFSQKKYFWFLKSCFPPKEEEDTLEEKIKKANKSYEAAKKSLEDLKKSATSESKEAKDAIEKAEQALKDAGDKLESFKKKK